jgi:hypothetical protein
MPLVLSVTVTSVKTTVMGGEQLGWNVAVTLRLKLALPFWTGKSPALDTLVLLAAFALVAFVLAVLWASLAIILWRNAFRSTFRRRLQRPDPASRNALRSAIRARRRAPDRSNLCAHASRASAREV